MFLPRTFFEVVEKGYAATHHTPSLKFEAKVYFSLYHGQGILGDNDIQLYSNIICLIKMKVDAWKATTNVIEGFIGVVQENC